MTVRRKPEDDAKVEILNWGPGTKAYRFVLLGAVLAATPPGQAVLNYMGIRNPMMDEMVQVKAEVTTMGDETAEMKKEVGELKTEIAAVKADVKTLTADVAAVKVKSDKLDTEFGIFKVDFAKYKSDTAPKTP